MEWVQPIVGAAGSLLEAAGVLLMIGGIVIATCRYAINWTAAALNPYRQYREDIGKSILLGLEVLVAADIIRTVAVTPTLDSVIVLGGIVLIRTFLSFSLEVELEGRWPWQRRSEPDPSRDTPATTGGQF